ncbi:MAG TPA: flagellar hook-basal body complex protein [Candidatus Baltobacteraceae bacterium]|jgi:flagellar hook protein FlgE|nr:flagellar hook-basal body complex protein [Candidatus Baltobacteraceae bacterium]
MLGSLNSAVSGLDNYQEQMDVIGNNIANVDTTGFKAGVVDFADAFSNTLQAPTAGSSTTAGMNSVQVGTGVTITGINSNWTQGALTNTGIPSDLAISGNGFFMVQDPTTSAQYATQAGDFTLNSSGYLVTDTGEEVLGYNNAGLSTIGPIQINASQMPSTSNPNATMTSYSIGANGQITVNLSDGTQFVTGQVLLQNFQDPGALISQGNNLYSNMADAGPLAAMTAPGASGLGTIQSGSLELSNVNLSTEMTNLITAQRAFEANSKIVTTSDEILQTVVNMKH